MGWIEGESFWLFCPGLADEFVRSEALEGLEPPSVIVGIDEIGKMALELPVAVVVIPLDGGFLDRPVHSFDLAVRPRVLDFG